MEINDIMIKGNITIKILALGKGGSKSYINKNINLHSINNKLEKIKI